MSARPSTPTSTVSTPAPQMGFGSLQSIPEGDTLTVFVVGASGDLARKKTFPALFELFQNGFLPSATRIVGYSRSSKTDQQFRGHLASHLTASPDVVARFLEMVFYQAGQYDSADDMKAAIQSVSAFEKECHDGLNHRYDGKLQPNTPCALPALRGISRLSHAVGLNTANSASVQIILFCNPS